MQLIQRVRYMKAPRQLLNELKNYLTLNSRLKIKKLKELFKGKGIPKKISKKKFFFSNKILIYLHTIKIGMKLKK